MGRMIGLRGRLLAMALLTLLPAVALIAYTYVDQVSEARHQANTDALDAATAVARDQANLVDASRDILTALARLPELRERTAECDALLGDLFRRYRRYTIIASVTPSGEIICTSNPAAAFTTIADREYYQRALRTREFTTSDYLIGRTSGKPVVTLLYPQVEGGEITHMIFTALDLGLLSQRPPRIGLPPGSTMTVIDRNGTVLSAYPADAAAIGANMRQIPFVRRALADGSGTFEGRGPDGGARLFGVARVDEGVSSPLVIVGIPTRSAFAAANRFARYSALGLAVALAVAVVMAWLGVEVVALRRLRSLTRAARRVAAGDFSTRTSAPGDAPELRHLTEAFDSMAAALEQRETDLRESRRFSQQVTASTPDTIYVYDLQTQRNVYLNREVVESLGYSEAEIRALGSDFRASVLHPDDLPRIAAAQQRVLRLADGEAVETEYRARHKDGQWRWMSSRTIVFDRDEDGRPIRTLGVAQDITDRKHAQDALRRSEERFRALVENGSDIIVVVTLDRCIQFVSASVEHILGYVPGELVGSSLVRLIHPDDRGANTTVRHRTPEEGRTSAPHLFRVRHRDGSWRVMEATGTDLLDDPAIHGVVINAHDVTEHERTREVQLFLDRASVALSESLDYHATLERLTALALPTLGDWCGVAMVELPDSLVRMASAALDPEKAKLLRSLDQAYPISLHAGHPLVRVLLTGEEEFAPLFGDSERAAVALDARHRATLARLGTVSRISVPLIARGQAVGVLTFGFAESGRTHTQQDIAVARDLARRAALAIDNARLHRELEAKRQQLEHQALTDTLTGLANRRLLHDRLAQVTAEASRNEVGFALLYLDLDGFKRVNDSLGHATGDRVLREVGQRLLGVVRPQDTVARLGGDEFVVLMAHMHRPADAMRLARRILAAIDLPFVFDDRSVAVSTSIGVRVVTGRGPDALTLLAHADRALYQAKSEGKARAVLYRADAERVA